MSWKVLAIIFLIVTNQTKPVHTKTWEISKVDKEDFIGCMIDLACCDEDNRKCIVYYVLCSLEEVLEIIYPASIVCLATLASDIFLTMITPWDNHSTYHFNKIAGDFANCFGFKDKYRKVSQIVEILQMAHAHLVKGERIRFANGICNEPFKTFASSKLVSLLRYAY